ncbi:MAG: AAA family ATPase [Ruminococcus sp.]|uniref:AAA family ATPase n=1 Tax=Ruminococcus sp. TaxID=41978 RepID=UPI002872CC8C|nr:AAA family ATPase [Ruminococcus sp.]MBQ3284192.1 AAA family ATPase [Ruminococcus sp.]
MKLIYCYIRDYKNIKDQSIIFCPDFKVEVKEGSLYIEQGAKKESEMVFFENRNLRNLHIIVGKTGSGKTNILNLIGMDLYNRIYQAPSISFFLVYHKDANEYAVELCNYSFSYYDDDKKQVYGGKGYCAYSLFTDEHHMGCNFRNLKDDTVIFNGYDKHSFSDPIYSDSRKQKYDINLVFLSRVNVPYQNTDLFFVCKYLSQYIKTFDTESDKRKASLLIRSQNWSTDTEDLLPRELIESDYYLYREHYLSEDLNNQDDSKNIIERKKCFIHDLMVDYALYLRTVIERNKLYLKNNPSVAEDQNPIRKRPKIRMSKYFVIDPNVLPDYQKMSPVNRVMWLAAYIDRSSESDAAGTLFSTAKNIYQIYRYISKYDKEYFAYDTFSLPVSEMFLRKNNNITDHLFYNMEQYDVPVDGGLFEEELLPYRLTCISAGEHQLARVFGSIEKSCFDVRINAKEHDVIYILDEPEIYMHPELCRCFIDRINGILKEHDDSQKAKSIQIIISTHSPFMLSDVLPEQVTRLNCLPNGKCEIVNGSDKQYFGANIHTIMADGFFLDYTIGEYSRAILQKMMDQLKEMLPRKDSLNSDESERVARIKACIPQIGDSIIRKSFEIVTEMFE